MSDEANTKGKYGISKWYVSSALIRRFIWFCAVSKLSPEACKEAELTIKGNYATGKQHRTGQSVHLVVR